MPPSAFFLAPLLRETTCAVELAAPTPDQLRLYYAQPLDADTNHDVVLSIPWSGRKPYLYHTFAPTKALPAVTSMDELLAADGPAIFLDDGVVHVKLSPIPMFGAVILDLCARAGCA